MIGVIISTYQDILKTFTEQNGSETDIFLLWLNFLHISSLYLLIVFFYITARKIYQVGLQGLLHLRVVCQTTLDSKRRKLPANDYSVI